MMVKILITVTKGVSKKAILQMLEIFMNIFLLRAASQFDKASLITVWSRLMLWNRNNQTVQQDEQFLRFSVLPQQRTHMGPCLIYAFWPALHYKQGLMSVRCWGRPTKRLKRKPWVVIFRRYICFLSLNAIVDWRRNRKDLNYKEKYL